MYDVLVGQGSFNCCQRRLYIGIPLTVFLPSEEIHRIYLIGERISGLHWG